VIGWLILGGYLSAALYAARLAQAHLNESFGGTNDDATDRFMTAFMGLVGGMMWPLAIPILFVMKHPKKTAKDYEREAAEREAHIRDLERELGIK